MPQVVDPLAIIAFFRPDIITRGTYVRLRIQVKGHRTRGCSMIDYFSPKSQEYNSYLVKTFDEEKIV